MANPKTYRTKEVEKQLLSFVVIDPTNLFSTPIKVKCYNTTLFNKITMSFAIVMREAIFRDGVFILTMYSSLSKVTSRILPQEILAASIDILYGQLSTALIKDIKVN